MDPLSFELTSLNRSNDIDNSSVESTGVKLTREAHLLLGGLAQGTAESAADGMSGEKWSRTLLSMGFAAALTIAMKRPGMLGNVARGAGTVGALNFAADLSNPRRLEALGGAFGDTWNSGANFDRNYDLVKKQLGPVGFDTVLGIGGGVIGSGLATRFCRPGLAPLPELPSGLASKPETGLSAERAGLTMAAENAALKPSATEPLNVFSRSNEPLGRALSNFAHTPFELDGVKYASVEAFYQSLKFLDPVKRSEIAPLYGSYAKSAAKKAPGGLSETSYMGEKINLGSPEHHALIERALRAKLEQNPEISRALVESSPRPIVHDTGRPASPNRKSNFPDTVFAEMVSKIRDDLVGRVVSRVGTFNPAALEAIEVKGGKSELVQAATKDTVSGAEQMSMSAGSKGEIPLSTVSDALLGIKKPQIQEYHNLEDYAEAFQGFDRKVAKVLGGGSDSVVMRLEDGNVLKITTRDLPADLGKRIFDLPVLEQGSRPVDGRQINYFVQPFAEMGRPVDLHVVGEAISRNGYHFDEPFLNQVGRFEGRPWLLDPFAVTKK